jgi:hypothetical protein
MSKSQKGISKRAQGKRTPTTNASAELTARDVLTAHMLANIMRDPKAYAEVGNKIGEAFNDLQSETQVFSTHPTVIGHAYLAAVAEARQYIAGAKRKSRPLSGRPQLLAAHIQKLDDIAVRYELEGLPAFFTIHPDPTTDLPSLLAATIAHPDLPPVMWQAITDALNEIDGTFEKYHNPEVMREVLRLHAQQSEKGASDE